MLPVTDQVRTCPVCLHAQLRSDPVRHVCASVLRETVLRMRGELEAATAQLVRISELVEHDNPVAGVIGLKREHADAWRWAEAAYGRGYRHGLRLGLALLHGVARRLPFGAWLTRRESAVLAREINMKGISEGYD